MKKLLIAFLVLGLIFAGVSLTQADSTRTIPTKAYTVAATNTVVSAQGVVVYKVTGYASSANAVFALVNANELGNQSSSATKVEGGEATQYDSLPYLDFGKEGLVFDTGLVVYTSTASVSIEYR